MTKKRSIMDHIFVPRARILSEEEVQDLLQRLKIPDKYKLPKLLSTDPLAVELGAKPGDVVELHRKSPISGESIYYRVVI